jgi:hypothetical protein
MRLLLEVLWYPLAAWTMVRGWVFELVWELLHLLAFGESARGAD